MATTKKQSPEASKREDIREKLTQGWLGQDIPKDARTLAVTLFIIGELRSERPVPLAIFELCSLSGVNLPEPPDEVLFAEILKQTYLAAVTGDGSFFRGMTNTLERLFHPPNKRLARVAKTYFSLTDLGVAPGTAELIRVVKEKERIETGPRQLNRDRHTLGVNRARPGRPPDPRNK
jgi:hypothetical protein